MDDEKVVPTIDSDARTEDADSELNAEELEDVQGGIANYAGGNYAGAEATERKRRAVQMTEDYAQNNNN